MVVWNNTKLLSYSVEVSSPTTKVSDFPLLKNLGRRASICLPFLTLKGLFLFLACQNQRQGSKSHCCYHSAFLQLGKFPHCLRTPGIRMGPPRHAHLKTLILTKIAKSLLPSKFPRIRPWMALETIIWHTTVCANRNKEITVLLLTQLFIKQSYKIFLSHPNFKLRFPFLTFLCHYSLIVFWFYCVKVLIAPVLLLQTTSCFGFPFTNKNLNKNTTWDAYLIPKFSNLISSEDKRQN